MSTERRPAPATSWNLRAPSHRSVSRPQAELARGDPQQVWWSGKTEAVTTDPALADELIAAVRTFVAKEVVPVASQLEHADAYPHGLVEQMKALGLFGCAVSDEYGGLGLDVLTYA